MLKYPRKVEERTLDKTCEKGLVEEDIMFTEVKTILDLATRSFSSDVQNPLVKLLQEGNQEVKIAHDSEQGKAILTRLKTRRRIFASFSFNPHFNAQRTSTGFISVNKESRFAEPSLSSYPNAKKKSRTGQR